MSTDSGNLPNNPNLPLLQFEKTGKIQRQIKNKSESAMFDFFEPTSPFASQTLRLVAEAQQGGGDLFDIARCVKRIECNIWVPYVTFYPLGHLRFRHDPGPPLAQEIDQQQSSRTGHQHHGIGFADP